MKRQRRKNDKFFGGEWVTPDEALAKAKKQKQKPEKNVSGLAYFMLTI